VSASVLTSARLGPRGYAATGSTVTALLVSLALIAAGYALKAYVESRTVTVSGAGITAQAPASWQVIANPNELVVRDPVNQSTLYAASAIDAPTGALLADVAQAATGQRASLLLGYQMLDQQPIRLGARDGYRIHYAYSTVAGGATNAQLIEGVDLYFAAGARIVAVSYEAPASRFSSAYAGFERFAASAEASQ
jgi:hypothetical protein